MTFFALLAATGHAVYQLYGEPGVTNWEVFYNVNNYLLYAAIFYDQGERYCKLVMWRYFFRTVCFFWMYSVFAELRYIGIPYDIYRNEIYNFGLWNNLNTILAAAAAIILIDLTKKYARTRHT